MSKYDRWGPSKDLFEVIPHDNNENITDSIRAPSDGVITLRALDDSVDVSHPVKAGEIIPVRTRYIRASGTTVSGSILAYGVPYNGFSLDLKFKDGVLGVLNRVTQPSLATVSNNFGFIDSPGSKTNLCPYSEEFDTDGWGKAPTPPPTITANTVLAPNGTLTADTWTRSANTSAYITRSISKGAIIETYTMSVFVKKGSARYFSMRIQGIYPNRADVTFDLNNGTVSRGPDIVVFTAPSASIVPVGGEWFRCSLTATTDAVAALSVLISFSSVNAQIDGTGGLSVCDGHIWGAQVEVGSVATAYIPTTTTAITNTLPRFEYDMGQPIIGASRTNLTPRSQALDNLLWQKNNTPVTSGATLLGLPAFTVSSTANLNSHIRSFSPQPLQFSTTYTRTIFAKAVSGSGSIYFEFSTGGTQGSAWFNLLTGVASINPGLGVASMQDMGDGVWRCRHTFTTTNTGTPHHRGVYIGVYGNSPAVTTVILTGDQLEVGSEPTDYIPTYETAVTTNLTYSPKVRGLMVEPARTNLARASETLTTGWSINNVPLVTGNVDPYGTLGGLLATFGVSNYAVCPATVVPNTPYTASVFVKWVAGTPRINVGCGKTDSTNGGLATFEVTSLGISLSSSGARGPGTFVGYTITSVGNGWFRLTCTGYGTDVSGGIAITAATVGTQLLLWGVQVEQGSEASSYIPTTTAAVTRPADILNLTNINKSDGTYTARCWHIGVDYTDVPGITVTNGAATITGVSVKPIQAITFI